MEIPITICGFENVLVDVLRLDLALPGFHGNKWFKLHYNLLEARRLGLNKLVTFGGAFSNHIAALAEIGNQAGFETIGIIRGGDDAQNPTLINAKENGMQLHFLSREEYRLKETEDFLKKLKNNFGDFYLIPEGGTNELAVKGCTEILKGIEENYDFIFLPVGTGGTIAGIISTPDIKSRIIGISVLKGDDQLTSSISNLIQTENTNWEINFDYHFGGYAKYDEQLIEFIRQFYSEYEIMPDPVYTGKMMYAVFDLIKNKKLSASAKILAIHTGGTQGIEGWEYRFGKIIS